MSQQILNLRAQGILEKVDILHFYEPTANPIDPSSRSAGRGQCEKFLRLVKQLLIVPRSRFYKQLF